MFSISFAITYIVILTCVMFLNLIISLSVLWIDNDIIAYIALQKQPLLFRGYPTPKSLAADAVRLFVVCLMVSVITVTEKEHPV